MNSMATFVSNSAAKALTGIYGFLAENEGKLYDDEIAVLNAAADIVKRVGKK